LLSYKYKLRAKNKDGTTVTKTEPVFSINDEHRGRDPRHDRDRGRDRAEPCRICEALKKSIFLEAVKSCPWRILKTRTDLVLNIWLMLMLIMPLNPRPDPDFFRRNLPCCFLEKRIKNYENFANMAAVF
jgi:hypothetical protein